MKAATIILILLVICPGKIYLYAQDNLKCNCSECNQFNFWIGSWEAVWQDSSGNKYTGSNTIHKILDDCVIAENFDGNPGMNFTGKSFSVYNKHKKIWEQTWVDSQGSYMLFTGGMNDNKMILSREVETKKGTVQQRMIFYNITGNSFDWNWESSVDGGNNWQLNWQIH